MGTCSTCGNAVCEGTEDCAGCPMDCGPCGEPSPEPPPDLGPDAAPPDVAADLPADVGPAEVGPDMAMPDARVAADAAGDVVPAAPDGSAEGSETFYGCPCQLGGARGAAGWSWIVLAALLAARRRARR
jgi:hypothetical protein